MIIDTFNVPSIIIMICRKNHVKVFNFSASLAKGELIKLQVSKYLLANLDEKVSIFKTTGNAVPASTADGLTTYWVLPTVDIYGNDVSSSSETPFYRI